MISKLNFLSNKEAENLNFHVCYSLQSELTAAEKEDIGNKGSSWLHNESTLWRKQNDR